MIDRDKQLIRAALEMAATEAEECGTCAVCGDGFAAAEGIRALDVDEVLAKVGAEPPTPSPTPQRLAGGHGPAEVWVTHKPITGYGTDHYLYGVSEKPWEADYDAPITTFASNERYIRADAVARLVEAHIERAMSEN